MARFRPSIPERSRDDCHSFIGSLSSNGRATSLHPEELHLSGPELDHLPLQWRNDRGSSRNSTRRRWSSCVRPVSCDNAHEDYRKLHDYSSASGDDEASHDSDSQLTTNGAADACTTYFLDTDSNTGHDKQGVNRATNDTLCSRCRGISVEAISGENGGYMHSTLHEIQQSARTCRLCKFLLHDKVRKMSKWTLDRYQIVIKLSSVNTVNDDRCKTDHFVSMSPFSNIREVLMIETVDIRPNEFPEGKRGRMLRRRKVDEMKWREHADHKGGSKVYEDNCVHERPYICYTNEGDPAQEMGVPWIRSIGASTASNRSFYIARRWLQQCLATTASEEACSESAAPDEKEDKFGDKPTNRDMVLRRLGIDEPTTEAEHAWSSEEQVHEQQSQPEGYQIETPARLIEIMSSSDDYDELSARLVETDGGSKYSYSALSYCWGTVKTGSPWSTTKTNHHGRLAQIPIKELPATCRESLFITSRLGLKYVWIDAICIIQDSKLDWASEAARIGGIYRGAVLTIAVPISAGCNDGCFNRSSKSHVFSSTSGQLSQRLISVRSILTDGRESCLHINPPDCHQFRRDILKSRWSKRGWTYQEQVLSGRILYYANSQLFWECEHCRLSEDNCQQEQNRHSYPITTYKSPLDSLMITEKWYLDVVENYSRRGLTYNSDKLVEISALARATYLNRHIEYVAGLWKDSIMPGLLWQRRGPGHKSVNYIGPSWSWVSQESPVSYELATNRSSHLPFQPRVMEVQVRPEDPLNPFGAIKSGYLELKTKITSGCIVNGTFDESYSSDRHRRTLVTRDASMPGVWWGEVVMDDQYARWQSVTAALLGARYQHWLLLVLEEVKVQAAANPPVYRRIGLAALDFTFTKPPDAVANWRQETIRIE